MGFRWLLCLFAIAACGVSGDDSRDMLPGRGSKTCRSWQDALCDYAADRCGISTREVCDRQNQGVTCKSDTVAKSCTIALDKAECGEATPGCMLDAVSDPEPAMQACEQFIDTLCERYVACGRAESPEACRQTPNVAAIDCARALTYSLDFEQCIDDIDALDCDADRPDSCANVIVLRSLSSS